MAHHFLEDLFPISPLDKGTDLWEDLSTREQQVLRLVALGHTNTEIAEELEISKKTVETFRARGMEKLELSSRAALVRYAIQKGLLTIE